MAICWSMTARRSVRCCSIHSVAPPTGGAVPRCNLSSWYVEPKFRSYGSLLITSAIKDKAITYFNVSSAPNTWPIVEAQGFSMYCRGEMFTLPALKRSGRQCRD